MDIFSPTILDNALITGSNNANLLQVSSPSAPSALFVSGSGNVGIGTTTPVHNLVVDGNTGISINAGGATFPNIHRDSADGGMLLRSWNGSTFTNNVKITPTSAVGIGTTNPIVRLHLSQSSGVFQRVDINNANADGVNATTQYYTNTGATPDLFGATSFRLQGGTTDAFKQFQVYIANLTSPRFIINGSGNVGINTTSPNARLHISGANNEALLIASSSTAPSALFVSGSGRVGIGTTTPSTLLHVSGTVANPIIIERSTSNSNIYIQYKNATTSWYAGQTDQNTFGIGTNSALGASTIFNISSSGNIGIGTNTPASLLHILSTSTYGMLRLSPTIANGESTIGFFSDTLGTDGNDAWVVGHAGWGNTGDFVIGNENNGAGGNVRLLIEKSGNVGIGETSPSARLEIRGGGATSATTALRVENSNASASLVVRDDGNVGIGTTSPITKLHVSGNIYTEDNLIIPSGKDILIRDVVDDTTGTIIRGTYDRSGIDPNFDYVSTSSIFLAGSTNTRIDLFGTNTTYVGGLPNFGRILFTIPNSGNALFSSPSNANILFVSGSGNIGVGTTTPGVTLDVVGNIRASSTMFNSVTQTNNIQLSSAFLRFLSASVETARYDSNGWGFFNNAPAAKVHISGANADALFRVSSPTASAALFISGSGNVGIGLLTPSARLHVSGANNQSLLRVSSPSASAALFVQGDGNVGIGTETPTGVIEVYQGGNSRILVTAGSGVGSGFVGLQQSSPAEYVHITSDPASTKWIQIDAASSQTPPTTAIVPDTGYGNTSNKIYLAEPDYWMEIKLNGNIVLIPCYLPA